MVGLIGGTKFRFGVVGDALVMTVCTTVCIACLVIGPDSTGIIHIWNVLKCYARLGTADGNACRRAVYVALGFGTVQRIGHIGRIGNADGLVGVTAGFGTVTVTGPAGFAENVDRGGIDSTTVQGGVDAGIEDCSVHIC